MSLGNSVLRIIDLVRSFARMPGNIEKQMMLQGKQLSESVKGMTLNGSLYGAEFSVFSQFGDDGIIQWLIHHLEIPHQTFVEFGVADYHESNTRFLLMNNNWAGFVMDGSQSNISRVTRSNYFWKHQLSAKSVFVDRDNVNDCLMDCGFESEVGLLHIDLDGMDYWVWKEISVISPVILILEYNSVFGRERAITVPYSRNFVRQNAHYSRLYWGASLRALQLLSSVKGYSFIGCNSAGNNAYFIRSDKLNSAVREITVEQGFVVSRYREARDQRGRFTFDAGEDRLKLIRGLPVYNVVTDQIEPL